MVMAGAGPTFCTGHLFLGTLASVTLRVQFVDGFCATDAASVAPDLPLVYTGTECKRLSVTIPAQFFAVFRLGIWPR